MRVSILLLGALALAAPAVAMGPVFGPAPDEREEMAIRALPPAAEVEALAPALDQMAGALLHVDVGPLLDAADPYRRRIDHGMPGRTLGELAHRDDPYFEDRLRSSIYGATSDIGRMIEAFAVAAPAMERSLREFERGIEGAIEDYDRRRPALYDGRYDPDY